jgi:AraC-like DNA-binding protein
MTKTAEARASVHIGAEKASWPAVSGTPAADFVAKATAEEEITLHRSRALPGVELWAIRGSTRPWTVLQSTYTFGVAERLSGEIVWRAGQRTSSLSLASTVLVEPGELQIATRVDGPADLAFMLVEPAALQKEFDRDLSDENRPHHFGSSKLDDIGLVGQFRRLWQAILDPHAEEVEQQSLFRSYVHALFERAGTRARATQTTRCEQALEKIRRVILERHPERLTLDGFAQDTGFSKFYLERSFHERYGLPIHQYLKKVRVARALDLLRQGIRPSVVSTRVGFADQPHMTRVFRDELGMTPRRFWTAANVPEAPRLGAVAANRGA